MTGATKFCLDCGDAFFVAIIGSAARKCLRCIRDRGYARSRLIVAAKRVNRPRGRTRAKPGPKKSYTQIKQVTYTGPDLIGERVTIEQPTPEQMAEELRYEYPGENWAGEIVYGHVAVDPLGNCTITDYRREKFKL